MSGGAEDRRAARRLHVATLLANRPEVSRGPEAGSELGERSRVGAAPPGPDPGKPEARREPGPAAFFGFGLAEAMERLSGARPVHAFLAGPGLRVPPRMERLTELFLAEITARQPRGPYFLGGYCFSGLLVIEIARALQARGERVGWVLLVEAPFPARWHRELHALRRTALALHQPRELLRFVANRMPRPAEPDGGIQAQIRAQGWENYQRWTAALLAGHRVRPFDLPVTLCFGAQSPERYFAATGWRGVSKRPLDIAIVPGRHNDVLASAGLAEHIDRGMRARELRV